MAATLTKAEAGYRATRVGDKARRCGNCSMYKSPKQCTLVKGVIDPEDICKHWEKKS